jgi:hypothetical protein
MRSTRGVDPVAGLHLVRQGFVKACGVDLRKQVDAGELATREELGDQAATDASAPGVPRDDKQPEIRDHRAIRQQLRDAAEFAVVMRREGDDPRSGKGCSHLFRGSTTANL